MGQIVNFHKWLVLAIKDGTPVAQVWLYANDPTQAEELARTEFMANNTIYDQAQLVHEKMAWQMILHYKLPGWEEVDRQLSTQKAARQLK